MKNYQKNAIFPSVLVSCMTNQLIHAEYEKHIMAYIREYFGSAFELLGSNGFQTK